MMEENTNNVTEQVPRARKESQRRFGAVFVFFMIIVLSIAISAIVSTYVVRTQIEQLSKEQTPTVREITQITGDDIVDVVDKVSPSVVSIVVSKEVPQYRRLFNSPFDLFFGDPSRPQNNDQDQLFEKQKVGGGTGFFITEDGLIVTNRHVVADQNADYTVIMSDGTEYSAEVLARDDYLDFAVLTVEGEDFTAVEIGDSDAIKIGQTVVAIGNSLGEFSHSVSRGIISGVRRDIVAGGGFGDTQELTDIIQTDAAINFGNSGGPLLDISGKVIGINTAVAQGAENIGFAIPINQVVRLIDDVKTTGTISRPFIGVRYVEMTPEIKETLNVDYDHGVLIVRGDAITDFAVLPGSPADEAGLVENDIILEINGEKIDEARSFAQMIASYNVGDTITLTVWHKGDEKEVSVTLKDKSSLNQK
jgi:S1-C subfamily serine protease